MDGNKQRQNLNNICQDGKCPACEDGIICEFKTLEYPKGNFFKAMTMTLCDICEGKLIMWH